jgi:hypothetical protein
MNDMLGKIARLVRDPSVSVDMTSFIFALCISVVAGIVVSLLYQRFYSQRATGSQVHRAFLLMSPSITALFIAIQFSLPLSLGLLGALSIIRFRTPIKEPEEVGFIFLLIASSVVCATFQFVLLFVLLGLAGFVLALQHYVPRLAQSARADGLLQITLNGDTDPSGKELVLRELQSTFARGQLQGYSSHDKTTTIHYTFTDLDTERLTNLQASLSQIAPAHRFNVFFNQQGSLL